MSPAQVLLLLLALALPARAEFIRGIYTYGAETFEQVSGLGFNLVVTPPTETNIAAAGRYGLMMIPQPSEVGPGSRELFASLRQESCIRAWYPYDEPDLYRVTPEQVRGERNWLREHAPEKPLFLTVWSPEQYAVFAPLTDILGIDPYPIVSAEDESRNRLERVFLQTAMARRVAPDKPLVVVVQCFFQNPWWERAPSAPELRNMVYQALAGGANGIIHFIWQISGQDGKVWRVADRPDLLTELKSLNRELRELEPALGGRLVSVQSDGGLVAGVRQAEGGFFVFAANPGTTRGSLIVALPDRVASARRIFGVKGASAMRKGPATVQITLPALGTTAVELKTAVR